ncbi:hypothetical protein PL599_18530, partial [Agrobacterium sp. ST15.16.055]|uniref:hypothetical protein n=1 Tax=Agrobacterium sp. ST15.16.055 TaxID=3020523 RepID=UPI002301006A
PPGDEETRLILSPVHPQKTTIKRHHPEKEKTRRKYRRVCQRSEAGFFRPFSFERRGERAGLEKARAHTNIWFNSVSDESCQTGIFESAAVIALTKD